MPENTLFPSQEETLLSEENLFSRFADFMLEFFRVVGLFFLRFLRGVRRRWIPFYRRRVRPSLRQAAYRFRRAGKWAARGLRYAVHRLRLFFQFFPDAVHVVAGGFRRRPQKNVLIRCYDALCAFGSGVRNNSHLFVTLVNYTLPVIGIFCLVQLIGYVQGLHFAVGVEYNGEQLGYIANETVFEEAEVRLQRRLYYLPTDETVDSTPKFTIAVASPAELKEPSEVTDAMIENSKEDMMQATGVYVDGELLGVVRDFSPIRSTLEFMKDKYKTNQAGERVDFTKDVEWEPGLYLAANVVDEQSVLDRLTSETEGNVYYTVVEGDTPGQIAAAYDMDLDTLESMNPGILESLLVGQQVLVNKSKPYLPVRRICTETYSQPIPYNTTYTTTDQAYQGETRTVTSGKEGEESVTAEVSYVDGVEVERTILSRIRLTEPVDAVIAKGTKVMQKAQTVTGGKVSNSGMINPIQQRRPYVSQGYKGSYHNGIDIAFRGGGNTGYGCPIVAVLPGTVKYAGWRGEYGNLVIIDHGNGYETWYAHNSKLFVSTGQKVAQGEQISAAGNTGKSYGVHLHFRVIANGVQVNPLNYIPGY